MQLREKTTEIHQNEKVHTLVKENPTKIQKNHISSFQEKSFTLNIRW